MPVALGQGLVHFDHLRVETVASGVQVRSANGLVVILQLLLALLLSLLEESSALGLQPLLAILKTLSRSGDRSLSWRGLCLCSLLLRRCLRLKAGLELFSLLAEHFSEALAGVGVFLAPHGQGHQLSVVERLDLLRVRLPNLADHLFLLFEELIGVDLWLCGGLCLLRCRRLG